jgi:hypothetical protein
VNVKLRGSCFLVTTFLVLGCFANAYAVVEWNVEKTFKLQKPPLDVAVSGNGQWVFVLTSGGKLLIYSAAGELKDSLEVGSHVDGVTAGPKGDVLFLSSSKGATVQQVVLDFIYDINTAGAPTKGNANAPVTIAVFSDFQ